MSKTKKKVIKYFEIPPGETAVVWTRESIFIDSHYCGTVHSKVKLVSQGIGHIGTRVNPNWKGVLAIALHNLSGNTQKVLVGETIAYLRFYKLISPSSYSPSIDSSGKLKDAIPEGFNIPRNLSNWIYDGNAVWRKGDKDEIKKVLENSEGYQNAKQALEEYKVKDKSDFEKFINNLQKRPKEWNATTWGVVITAIATVILAVVGVIQIIIGVIEIFK